jgi:hypothetical protein
VLNEHEKHATHGESNEQEKGHQVRHPKMAHVVVLGTAEEPSGSKSDDSN